MLEAALLKLFDETDEPDIYIMRETLSRLARICPIPNKDIMGQWIIYWASSEGAVDRIFGTGMTVDAGTMFGFGGMELQEFLLKFNPRKGANSRVVEGVEVIRKIGPFPNQSNNMRGSYNVIGTRGLMIQFDDIKTQGDEDVEVNGEKVTSKSVELDVLYSSKGLVAMQAAGKEEGEYDFFVLTPIDDIGKKRGELLGLDRRRFFFN